MDIIKYTSKSKCLGKHKCSCGLVVRLYEEDLNNSNQWTCPGCDTCNHVEDTKSFPVRIVAIIACITLLFVGSIGVAIAHNVKMSKNYTYTFETYEESESAWKTYYTNEDVRALSSLPAGFECYDWYNNVHYAQDGQPIRNIQKI